MVYPQGKYRIEWENKQSSIVNTSIVSTPTYYSSEADFEEYLSSVLPNYDKLAVGSENPIMTLSVHSESTLDPIAICQYNDSLAINSLIHQGYHIREFFSDICVLEKRPVIT